MEYSISLVYMPLQTDTAGLKKFMTPLQ